MMHGPINIRFILCIFIEFVGTFRFWLQLYKNASACHTDTTPTSHTETPTHIETRTHNQCGDTIEKSQTPDDGCINVRSMLSIERSEIKLNTF